MKTIRHLITGLALLVASFSFAQNCPNLGPDQFLPCGVTSTTLTANTSLCTPGSTSANQTTTYGVSSIPFAPWPATGTTVTMSDDQVLGPFPIGFNFCFFGNTYTQFYIGSNGWISFSAGQPATFTSAMIPSGAGTVPKNCIMGPWQDWHPGIAGGPYIRYQTQGTAPCRRLVVSWTNCPMFSCTTTYGTFQIVLYEASNIIENYLTNKPNCLAWAGGTAVQGLHNLPGTVGITVPGRNSTAWTATNEGWRYTPAGPVVNPVLNWYVVGNPIPFATGVTSVTVTPSPGGTQYTAHYEYTGCNAGLEVCSFSSPNSPDTVLVVPGSPSITATTAFTNPLCSSQCNGTATVTPTSGIAPFTYLWTPTAQITSTATGLCAGTYNVTVTDNNGCTGTFSVTLVDPPALTSSVVSVNASCFGVCDGTATVTPVGGTPAYTYNWLPGSFATPGISSLCPGTYTVTVTDANGCTTTNSVTITSPPAVVIPGLIQHN